MASARGSSPPLLRPEFGPTLPGSLHRRLGIPQWLTMAAVALVLLLVALVIVLSRPDVVQLNYRIEPAFNLLVQRDVLKQVDPRRGELVRLQVRRPRVAVSVTASPLQLAAHQGFATGQLPLITERRIATLRASLANVVVLDEGKARVNKIPGYQIGFRAGSARRPIYGRDVLLVPDSPGVRRGVVLRFLQQNAGGALRAKDLHAIFVAKKAFRSFRFGTDRP